MKVDAKSVSVNSCGRWYINKLQPSGPSTCFPAAWATACATAGLDRGDAVNGDVYDDIDAADDGVDGVAANCEVSASAALGPEDN